MVTWPGSPPNCALLEVSFGEAQRAYQMNVLLNPFQTFSLIKKPYVEVTIGLNLLAGKETPNTNAVVESDNDNIIVSCVDQTRAIQVRIGERVEPATLEVDKDRMK